MASATSNNAKNCQTYRILKRRIATAFKSANRKAHLDRIVHDALVLTNTEKSHQHLPSVPAKAYAVVEFLSENTLEVIPTKWILSSELFTRWPPNCSESIMKTLILNCVDAEESWRTFKIKVHFKTNSFAKATSLLRDSSNAESDSDSPSLDENYTSRKRKIKVPPRFCDSFSKKKRSGLSGTDSSQQVGLNGASRTDEEPEIGNNYQKKHQIPVLPPNVIPCSLEFSSGSMGVERNGSAPPLSSSTPKHHTSPDGKEIKNLIRHLVKVSEKTYQKMIDLEEQLNDIKVEMSELKNWCEKEKKDVQPIQILDSDLPVDSDPALIILDNKLREDKKLQCRYIRFLYDSCLARNLSCFMTVALRRVVTKDVAVQYSRLGRKGKKSFMELSAIYDTIIGAASIKFPSTSPEDLAEKFSKALALAGDWDGRKKPNPTTSDQ